MVSKAESNDKKGLVPFRQLPVIFSSFIVWTAIKTILVLEHRNNLSEFNSLTVLNVKLCAGSFGNVRHPHVQILLLAAFKVDALVAVLHLSDLQHTTKLITTTTTKNIKHKITSLMTKTGSFFSILLSGFE